VTHPAPHADALVVGAGIAGLTAARELRAAGLAVAVLEKSRGLGGRAATRRIEGVRVDHGAQFLTVRDPRFQRAVAGWLADGTVVPWADGVATWSAADGWHHPDPRAHPRYACPAGMSALGQRLAEGLEVVREARATAVRRSGAGWTVDIEGGGARHAPRLLVTAPVPQALALLAGVPGADRPDLRAVAYAPCFAVVAGYEGVEAPDWPGVRLSGHPDLAWVGHDSQKRAQPRGPVLVLHATPAFSRDRADAPPAATVAALLRAATDVVPWADRPLWSDHQRWRYALPERPHLAPALDLGDGLVLAGDAFGGEGAGRIEGAYLSGLAAAGLLLGGDRP